MPRLAAAMLIAIAALVINGGMIRDAFAEDLSMHAKLRLERPDNGLPVTEPRGTRILSLLLALQALGNAPGALDTPKV